MALPCPYDKSMCIKIFVNWYYTVGEQILISENTCKDANTDLQIAGQLQIEPKGIKHPVTICEIHGIGGKYNLFLPQDDEIIVSLNQELPVK